MMRRSWQYPEEQLRSNVELESTPRWGFRWSPTRSLVFQGEDACEFQDACFYRWRDNDRMWILFWFQDMVVTKIAEISPTSGAGRKSIKVCWVLGSTSKRKDSIRAIFLFSRRSFKQSILKYIHVFIIPFLSGGPSRAERHVAPKAQPRARLAITAKSKPPQGKSDDFTMVFTDVQGFSLRSWNFRAVCVEFFWKTSCD